MITAVSLRKAAVSDINGKVDYSGGNAIYSHGGMVNFPKDQNSSVLNNFGGSISLPVTHSLGFQVDGLYSKIAQEDFYGGAAHFFWRDPDLGLLGLTGGYLARDGDDSVNTYQAGAEGQYYYKQFTFGFFAGIGSIDYRISAPFIPTDLTRFVGRVSVDYYPLENLRVGASVTTSYHDYMASLEIEYQTPINGIAITGEGDIGHPDYNQWLIGLRYYFGGNKTLRDRQRQDDPPGLMSQILQSLGLYGSKFYDRQNNWLNSADGIYVGPKYYGGGSLGYYSGPAPSGGGGNGGGDGGGGGGGVVITFQ
ncbi:MAG: hypothetical protein ABSE48_06270 [Verrucomicrobiota bacterium]